MGESAQLMATLACTVFTGAAVYISLVEHPDRLTCSVECAYGQWAPSYRRAAIMQASLALVATISSMIAWVTMQDVGWLVAGLIIFAVVPYTLVGCHAHQPSPVRSGAWSSV